ncbi:hypothetical protein ACWS81_01015 [Psychrobacter celer]
MSDDNNKQLNHLAIRCFRDIADQDYIHARLAHKYRLSTQFLWSSLHCLEKYAKSILLQNRINGRKIGHEVTPALYRFETYTEYNMNLSEDVTGFIKRLEERARFRYLETGNIFLDTDILLLDKSVHQVRRYCQQFSFEKHERNKQISELALLLNYEKKIKDITKINLDHGLLEEIIEDKKHPSRQPLIYQNAFFSARKRKTISIKKGFNAFNSPFQSDPKLVELANQYIHIPKEIFLAYKEDL